VNSFHSFKSYIFLETVYILHVALVRRLIGVITYFDVAFIVIHYGYSTIFVKPQQ